MVLYIPSGTATAQDVGFSSKLLLPLSETLTPDQIRNIRRKQPKGKPTSLIPPVPDHPPTHKKPSAVKGERLSSLIEPSGGFTDEAYLRMAGGLTGESDEDELYILKADGNAISRREAGGFLSSFMSVRLDQGDTIVVPEKIQEVSYLREFNDITQILFQIATTAGVLIVAF